DGPVAGAVFEFAFPDLATGNRSPEIANEILRVKAGIDNAMILAQQISAGESRDAAEFIVNIIDDAALICNCDNRRLVKRKLNVGELFEGSLKRFVVYNVLHQSVDPVRQECACSSSFFRR